MVLFYFQAMLFKMHQVHVVKSGKIFNRLTFILYLLFLQTQALHCHRKHDHSSDVLLQSDISTLGGQSVLQHSHEDTSKAAKLVQLQDSDSTDNSSNDVSNETSSSSAVLSTKNEGVNVTRTGGGRIVAFCPARYQCKMNYRP